MEKYKNEDWLRREYLTRGRNATDIADDFDVHHQTIYYYIDKFDIPKRSRGFRKGEKHPNYSGGKEEYECPVCGITFEKRPCDVENVTHGPFCSRECHNEHKREYMQGNDYSMSGEEHPLYDNPEANPMYGVRGEDHPNYKGGYESDFRWTPEWYHTRKFVLDRDGHECQDCGVGQDEHIARYDRELEVHHKTPVSEGGAKYDEENLVALCMACHHERHRD